MADSKNALRVDCTLRLEVGRTIRPETSNGNRIMAVEIASSLFTSDEAAYCKMLEGGVFVGDRWFGKDTTEADRVGYLASYLRRKERNRRRRERRKADDARDGNDASAGVSGRGATLGMTSGARLRRPPLRIPFDIESQRKNRSRLERRKCTRRSTLAVCPTPGEIRTAWHFRNVSEENRIRLGGLLMDLECYVDNSLKTIVRRGLPKIVGRNGGMKAWLRENCPELVSHYKTLQRIKGLAKRLCQRMDILDPMPVTLLMDRCVSAIDIETSDVHVQPRGTLAPHQVVGRYPWELSQLRIDADGRPYLGNANYELARREVPSDIVRHLAGYRSLLAVAISLNGKENRTIETYCMDGATEMECGVKADDVGNSVGEWRALFAHVRQHPMFLVETGWEMAREMTRGVGEMVLPARTSARIRRGEKVGVGRVVMDVFDAYMKNVYEPCLPFRWMRG